MYFHFSNIKINNNLYFKELEILSIKTLDIF